MDLVKKYNISRQGIPVLVEKFIDEREITATVFEDGKTCRSILHSLLNC